MNAESLNPGNQIPDCEPGEHTLALLDDYWAWLRRGGSLTGEDWKLRNSQYVVSVEPKLRMLDLLHEACRMRRIAADRGAREIQLRCPNCRQVVTVLDHGTDEPASCSACGGSIVVAAFRTCPWSDEELSELNPEFDDLQIIGGGAFGTVLAAREKKLNRKVAIKIPHRDRVRGAQNVERFMREAQGIARLEHPGIVRIYSIGETPSRSFLFIVTEFLNGRTLAQALSTGELDLRSKVEIVAQVAAGVHFAHQQGVIHRDLKPSNIMLCRRDTSEARADGPTVSLGQGTNAVRSQTTAASIRAVVTDFGLAFMESNESTLTATCAALGTPAYMSPEQARGESHAVDPRTDVYSLGVILYQALVGELPFNGSPQAVFYQVIHDEPRSPRRLNEHTPRDLETIALRAMGKKPQWRYRTAGELAAELRRWLVGEPIHARPVNKAEWLWRWSSRNRLVATLTVGIFAVIVLGALISTYFAIESDRRADLALQRLYFSEMILARVDLLDGQVGRALELLEQHGSSSPTGKLRRFEWYYLDRLCHSDLLTLKGHTGWVHTVAFSPDGQRLASGDGNGHIRIWDVFGGQELLAIGGHNGSLNCLAFLPDGERLVSAGSDRLIRIWSLQTGEQSLALTRHTGDVNGVAVSHDGERLASGSSDGTIRVWDAKTGGELLTLTGRMGGRVNAVGFSPDGRRLASAGGELYRFGAVEVWDATTGDELLTLKGPANDFNCVAFSPDGQRIASGNSDGTVKVWDATTGEPLLNLVGHRGSVGIVAFSPDGQRLASSSSDETVKMWDATTGDEMHTLRGHTGPVTSVAFSPDGQRLASGSHDDTVKLWNAGTGNEPLTLKGSALHLSCVVFSPDSQRLAASANDVVKVWNAYAGQELLTLIGHAGEIDGLAFSPDGERMASASDDGTVKIWDARNGKEMLTLKGHSGWVASVSFSPDGHRIVSAGGERDEPGEVKVWDATSGKESLALRGHSRFVRSVAFAPDGRRLASGSADRTIKVWDASTGHEFRTLTGHTGPVRSVAFSPDGRRLASAGGEANRPGEIKVWDARTGKELLNVKPHTDKVQSVAFSPDGQRIASASDDDTIKLWDVSTGQEVLTLKGRRRAGGFTTVAFSPDGRRLAAVSWDGTITIWDATPLP